ncbi:MAG: YbgC/FadM family acyl-CoA thioesterase [Verrucomicrobia bacterium]|nr:YbgC/FadM family acyl-CoA thioesterase [Verrucomicrobiota bacterium]
MLEFSTEIRVRYAETDRMNVVHHSNYFVWFEAARIHLLDHLGLPYRDLEAAGYFIPVLEAQANYKRPAQFDDRLQIELQLAKLPRARFHFDYTVRCDGTLLTTGYTVHAFMDASGKALRPPEQFMNGIAPYFGNASEAPAVN